jgi:hypothetical protein
LPTGFESGEADRLYFRFGRCRPKEELARRPEKVDEVCPFKDDDVCSFKDDGVCVRADIGKACDGEVGG